MLGCCFIIKWSSPELVDIQSLYSTVGLSEAPKLTTISGSEESKAVKAINISVVVS